MQSDTFVPTEAKFWIESLLFSRQAGTGADCARRKTSNLVPADVQELLDQRKDIASMSYNYKRVDKPLEPSLKFWIKGVMVKRELPIQRKVLNKNEMDIIIFNTVSRTANFYCESQKYCIKTGDIGSADYDQYYIKTPLIGQKKSPALKRHLKNWYLIVKCGC